MCDVMCERKCDGCVTCEGSVMIGNVLIVDEQDLRSLWRGLRWGGQVLVEGFATQARWSLSCLPVHD
jgi:hypothetical protein